MWYHLSSPNRLTKYKRYLKKKGRVRPDAARKHGAVEQITTHMSRGPPLSISLLGALPS